MLIGVAVVAFAILDQYGQGDVGEELLYRVQAYLDELSGSPSDVPWPGASTDGARDADIDFAVVAAALDGIVVEPERRRGYEREDWPHWLDSDGDCLNTREEVLIAQSLERPQLSGDGCGVVSGLWLDPYTGEQFRDPSVLDIDHIVSLQEAHDSGGHQWSRERRAAFANDFGNLIAVSRSANRAKGAKGPEEWLPPDPGYFCRYVADWIAVKAAWGLSMDESERIAVGNMLRDCHSRQYVSAETDAG